MAVQREAAQLLWRLAADDGGATLTEYALIVAAVSIGIGFVMPEIVGSIEDLFADGQSGLRATLLKIGAPKVP